MVTSDQATFALASFVQVTFDLLKNLNKISKTIFNRSQVKFVHATFVVKTLFLIFTQKICWLIDLWSLFFSSRFFFYINLSWTWKPIDILFWSKSCFGHHNFLHQKIWTKFIIGLNNLLTKFFWTAKFLDLKVFKAKFFWLNILT